MAEHETVLYDLGAPTSDTGIYLHRHSHEWIEIGAHRMAAGTWHPVFKCMRCGDVLCDLHVEVQKTWADPDATDSETGDDR